MAENNSLKRAMLEADGIKPTGISPEDREILNQLLKRDRRRVAGARRAMIIGWSAILLTWIVAIVGRKGLGWSLPGIEVGWNALWPLAWFLTAAFAVRAYQLRMVEFKTQLTDIQARLDSVEGRLRQSAEKV
jgi:hypothetical protein